MANNIIITPVVLGCSVLAFCLPAAASGMQPTCQFSTRADRVIFNGAKYRIGDAYRAASLVVIGRVTVASLPNENQRFHVSKMIKGKALGGEIELVGSQCYGTACTGLRLPQNQDFLLLLRQVSATTFHKVDGNGNDACPNVFEVRGNQAKIGNQWVEISALRQYFTSKPVPIPFP